MTKATLSTIERPSLNATACHRALSIEKRPANRIAGRVGEAAGQNKNHGHGQWCPGKDCRPGLTMTVKSIT